MGSQHGQPDVGAFTPASWIWGCRHLLPCGLEDLVRFADEAAADVRPLARPGRRLRAELELGRGVAAGALPGVVAVDVREGSQGVLAGPPG